ncbi:MAG: VanW family protein [Oscillospiraceae bacterium]|nr:VanW family protein [Oscillospiraceae bacterium]
MAKGKFEKGKASAATKAVARSGAQGKKRAWIIAAISGGTVLALFLTVLIWGAVLNGGKKIYPNVRVAGVEVGGMTLSAATGEVEGVLEEAYDQTLEVRLPDRTLQFAPDDVNVSIDVGEAVEKAMGYGRGKGALRAWANWLAAAFKEHDIELELALELDREHIEDVAAVTAKDVFTKPQNTKTEVEEDRIVLTKGAHGVTLDEEGLVAAVCTAFETCDFTPIDWEYEHTPYVEADLEALYESISQQTKDAYYDEENHVIVEEVIGHGFDYVAQGAKLAAAEAGKKLTIMLEEILPEVTAEQLNAEMFGEKLESRSSPYVNNANRTENLRIACESINGMIINPGEVFSFNTAVGERTEERGFKPATIYGGEGESVDGIGGGICQVASTIYYTTLYMDLEQVMREPHMYQVTYVPSGMDATVYWDSGLDYKFRNNRENPIKIQANVDGGHVNITFWGVKENDNYVEMTYKVLETFTSEDEEEVDETKEPGFRELKQTAYVGAKVEAYQKVFDGDGKLIKENTIKSTYKSRPNIYIVGPTEEEEELPDPNDPSFDPDDPNFDPDDPFGSYDPEDDDLPWPGEDEFWP